MQIEKDLNTNVNSSSFLGALLRPLRAARLAFLELVLPPACCLCNQPVASEADFCRTCEVALTATEAMMRSCCPRCGMPKVQVLGKPIHATSQPDSLEEKAANGKTAVDLTNSTPSCAHCGKGAAYDEVTALWAYRDRVCEAVVAAKYSRQAPLAHSMGRRLAIRVGERWPDPPDLVTFVPSHVTRQFSRGGTGCRTIAEAVAQVIGIPCMGLVRANRRIAKQAWLDDQERENNVRDAFSPIKSYAYPRTRRLANRHVLLVDDVLTTGATANEVARVLRSGGATRVSVAVVARAVRAQ